ncbi:glycoside hydrolase family 17 protein [Lepidopterella palustris CBS 459.81]|uniref:Probable glucan endo-1,3-beta-glucosidase eglC n=1 Tax=Lepidopterella palustris CBS 459.81 TaxID=1314670 RepID=A0A8E2EJP1_9PEZI|nr:glycoside hydrolase family 17 protein [Lepidopterella palustris CBS 459.81]
MKFSTFATVAMAVLSNFSGAEAYWKGFNVGATNPDGSCKSQADWETAFNTLKGLPGYFTSVRLYAASDCNTLANAVPAALATGMQILVGVWTEDDTHFNDEKQALLNIILQYGSDWIIAVSVGSEDLYRGDTTPDKLASQINDVRGMIRSVGANQEVGHVDTWTAWVNSANNEVISACDFVGTDGYPYFQYTAIQDGANVFWQSVQATRDAVNAVKPGTWVWITETGWPVSGGDYGAAVPSVSNAQAYWTNVACAAFEQAHTFWYSYQDYSASPSFGVVDANRNPIYNLAC